MAYQGTFAIITAALISGSIVERMRFGPYLVFITLWSLVVYAPVAHQVWGGGLLAKLGALDFAGGTVVHVNAGVAALVAALVLGPRKDHARQAMLPHNVPFTLLGAGLLWFGWFGFNAGSALGANALAANALVVTNTSAAAGALTWLFASWLKGKPSALGMVSGGIAGLVAITPAAGYVDVKGAITIGAIAGVLCYFALLFRVGRGLDESCDAWAVHGMGGLWGAIATGIFATASVNNYTGLIYGNFHQFTVQIIAAGASVIYAFVMTLILAKIVDATMGLRVTEDEEYVGLDIAQHGEKAYA